MDTAGEIRGILPRRVDWNLGAYEHIAAQLLPAAQIVIAHAAPTSRSTATAPRFASGADGVPADALRDG